MQRQESISAAAVPEILSAAFAGKPVVYEAYSGHDQDLLSFNELASLESYISKSLARGEKFIQLALHYPEARGVVTARKIDLNPTKCNGATLRYAADGWGLIQLQMKFSNSDFVQVRVAANSESRASTWATTSSVVGAPDSWDWKAVEKHARRLIRVLRKQSTEMLNSANTVDKSHQFRANTKSDSSI